MHTHRTQSKHCPMCLGMAPHQITETRTGPEWKQVEERCLSCGYVAEYGEPAVYDPIYEEEPPTPHGPEHRHPES